MADVMVEIVVKVPLAMLNDLERYGKLDGDKEASEIIGEMIDWDLVY